MNVTQFFKDAAGDLKSLRGRLEIQNAATRDKDDKADVAAWITAIDAREKCLIAFGAAYGPILQSAIDTGNSGQTHRIAVETPVYGVTAETDGWQMVSAHEFTVEPTIDRPREMTLAEKAKQDDLAGDNRS